MVNTTRLGYTANAMSFVYRIWWRPLCLCFGSVLFATGCGPIEFTPSTYATVETSDSWKDSPPYPCPVSSSGIFVFNPGSREAAGGIDLIFDEGTEPLPCQEWHGELAKANIVFDQGQLEDVLGSLSFSKAELKFRLTSSGHAIGGPDLGGSSGCLLRLGIATERWPGGVTQLTEGAPGSRPAYRLHPSVAFVLSEPLPTGFVPPADVTAEVKAWLDGSSPNFGFVLVPFATPEAEEEMRLSRLQRLTASCSALVSDARLEISGR